MVPASSLRDEIICRLHSRARDIHIKAWAGLADRDAVAAAIETLCSAGYIREISSSPSEVGGRPTVGYIWNPHIKEEEK